jgi:hypothetical protein
MRPTPLNIVPPVQLSINRSRAMPVKYCKTISSALENEGYLFKKAGG